MWRLIDEYRRRSDSSTSECDKLESALKTKFRGKAARGSGKPRETHECYFSVVRIFGTHAAIDRLLTKEDNSMLQQLIQSIHN